MTDDQIKALAYQLVFKKLCPYCNESIVDNVLKRDRGQAQNPGVDIATLHQSTCQGVLTFGA